MAEPICCGDYLVERVPVEEERQKLEIEEVYTAQITPQQTARALQFASKMLPRLDGLEHVKRIKRETGDTVLHVILCQCKALDRDQLDGRLRDTEWADLDIAVGRVPTTPPYTREQFDEWRTLWPVAYRPLVKLKAPSFSDDEKAYIQMCLRRVEELQEGAASGRSVAAAIGNPNTRQVVAEARDATAESGNPLRHAVLCCISLVAEREVAREADRAQKRPASPPETGGGGDGGYLCDSMDVFTTREPCVMCSMALVHSRIGRLFFIDPSSGGGGISRYSMHSRKQLNHHFVCFQCTRAGKRAL
ncbi:tRNA-specific adenosine deaminase subunit tad3 [Coemansia nantahalensis]|uniref:tRNA-specific adenosine deaminase subunit tad3 n=1 Tax=Coemansia nantahalensis TaxID=2789366 RepID=A0ACC1JW01_9FUNG|nr:tRNA-specific adenosine deaminase subunit tad3 [Coemansia nantahalensis]